MTVGKKKFGPIAQLGWSVRLIKLFRYRKVVGSNPIRPIVFNNTMTDFDK
ncbi:protein of unknown function [Candidatus Nitrosotalea okcheonensis]|uniref:Uncharacterized protein n=1 Tax=Candidatus Nitrosotalea okcheonensis TaxID=1903276 RepID=A0A2H1FG45_9ARCH|nr:protein of unknown function [Candidatus Nitrosotalea okcheonensis]